MNLVSSEMASGTIRFLERTVGGSRASSLARLRIDPQQIRTQVAASVPLTPEQVKRAMARQVKKGSCGRGGLPEYVIKTMYADYLALKSLQKVGKLYGRTRQSIYIIFKDRGLSLIAKKFQKKIEYRGRSYTPGKGGYYRATSGDRVQLHHQMWEDNYGPVPSGHQVSFKDADCTNLTLDNFICRPIREVTLFHHSRHQAA